MDDKIPFRKVIGHHWGHDIPAQTTVDFEIKFILLKLVQLKPWNPANQILEWKNGIFDFEADWEELTANNCVQIMINTYNIHDQRFEEYRDLIQNKRKKGEPVDQTAFQKLWVDAPTKAREIIERGFWPN